MKEVSSSTSGAVGGSGSTCSVSLSFHLAGARRCTPDECEDEAAPAPPATASKAFLKLHSLVELDTFTLTHGPFTPLDTPG